MHVHAVDHIIIPVVFRKPCVIILLHCPIVSMSCFSLQITSLSCTLIEIGCYKFSQWTKNVNSVHHAGRPFLPPHYIEMDGLGVILHDRELSSELL